MPSTIPPAQGTGAKNGIIRFTNCYVIRSDDLVEEDLWINSIMGRIISSQSTFFDELILPDEIIDLKGRIISPGMIDVQLNGAFGFNFSTLSENPADYAKKVAGVNEKLVSLGVTSYLPTLTSQQPELYQRALPHLGPSVTQVAKNGAESLGAHVEGPFLNPAKNGIHNKDVLIAAESFEDIENCYGSTNLTPSDKWGGFCSIKKITLAPERGHMTKLIPELRSRSIVCSIGHTEATYEEATAAIEAGATMITHVFNAMRPLHHRDPGIFGVLGTTPKGGSRALSKPYFGVIADGIHLHPTVVNIAFNSHPEGFILVTDAMHIMGLPDGTYEWTNGDINSNIVKKGPTLVLEGTEKIAGSSISLLECVNNFTNQVRVNRKSGLIYGRIGAIFGGSGCRFWRRTCNTNLSTSVTAHADIAKESPTR